MMKLFDAPRLLFAFALVVFFAFFAISRWSAVPPPLGLPPRLPRDPDANAPLESRAVAIVVRAVAIVARLRTDQSEADRGRSRQLSAPPPRYVRASPISENVRHEPKLRKSESLVLHFMDVLSSSASALPSSAAQREAHCQGGNEAFTTCREGFAIVAPDLCSRPRSRPPVAAGSEFDLRKYLPALFSDGSDGERLDGGFHAVRTRCLFPRVPSEPSRFVWPHERAETRVGGDTRGGRSEARRDAFGEPRRAKRRFH
jgi:hypothetical protein